MDATADKATPGDIPALVDLMREFYAEAGYALDVRWAADSFSALLGDHSRGSVRVIRHGKEAAGYVVLTVRFSMEYGGLDAFIDDLFIRPAYRRRGLARAALRALFDECRRRGVLAVHVEVGTDNDAAKALYASYGLRPGGDDRQLLTARLGDDSGGD